MDNEYNLVFGRLVRAVRVLCDRLKSGLHNSSSFKEYLLIDVLKFDWIIKFLLYFIFSDSRNPVLSQSRLTYQTGRLPGRQ